jgi:hypothetical protein
MCDIARERKRIDLILRAAIARGCSSRRLDAEAMVDVGLTALRDSYADSCSEDCMRARCESFVGRFGHEFLPPGPARNMKANGGAA